MFLPWYGLGPFSINAWDSQFWAWGGSLLVIAGAVVVTLKALEIQDLKVGNLAAEQLGLVLAGAGFVFVVLRLITESSATKYGLFLAIIAGGAVTFGAFGAMKDAGLELPTSDSFKSSDDS
jgi:hypothetical protein